MAMTSHTSQALLSALLIASSATVAAGVSAAPTDTTLAVTVPAPPTIDYTDDDPWQHPVRPPICNEVQLEMGDVRSCVVRTYGTATDNGWPMPPAPRSGSASEWRWNGYDYRGSPALEDWESEQITSNEQRIGGIYAGDFSSHIGIAALFEGFLAEIVDRGYEVRNAIGYGFRCTNASGGWDCPSGNVRDLSFHAWGLAFDMNSDANPITTYRHPAGGNACEVAMATDMPQWVVQTAEKWGLYWGGYGWGDGCSTPATAAYRDPPHFEFRGTPEMADQILKFNLRNDPGLGCYDVVSLDGSERMICNREFVVEPNWRVAIDPGAPVAATAAVVNLTATSAESKGFLSLESCAPRATGLPATSNVNFAAGQNVANLAIIPLDDDGRFCLFHSTNAHGIVDVIAFLAPIEGGTGLRVVSQHPQRIVDTRSRALCDTDGTCSVAPVGHKQAIVISDAPSVPYLANLTVTRSVSPGFISAGSCEAVTRDNQVPNWSNLNYRLKEDRANLAIIRPDESFASCAYSQGNTDFIVDVLATLTSESEGLGLALVEPNRLLDTRTCADPPCAYGVDRGRVLRVPVATDAPVIAVNITATGAPEWGFITVDRCSTLDALTGSPSTSTVNINKGVTAANLTFAEVEDGEICIWSYGRTHLIVDLQAELHLDAELGIELDDPVRVYDGRKGGNSLVSR